MEIYLNEKLFACWGDDLPTSVNSMYRAVSSRLYKPVSVIRWEEMLQHEVKKTGREVPLFPSGPLHALFCWIGDRADIDNRLKSAMDAMNGVVYSDDSVIASLTALKLSGRKGFFCCVSKNPFRLVSKLPGSYKEIAELLKKGEL